MAISLHEVLHLLPEPLPIIILLGLFVVLSFTVIALAEIVLLVFGLAITHVVRIPGEAVAGLVTLRTGHC